jgi:hypothetical protein
MLLWLQLKESHIAQSNISKTKQVLLENIETIKNQAPLVCECCGNPIHKEDL